MTVQHESQPPQEVHVTRTVLDARTVESHMLDREGTRVGYLRVRTFGTRTGEELEQGLAQLDQDGAAAYVLDLRNNGGGLVTAAVSVCSNFLPEGTQIVTVNRRVHPEVHAAHGGLKISKPLVVLVNHNSASASEITAGAIHDTGVGTVVGSRSFGKGTVQRYFPLGDGSGLKFTTALYRTPAGTQINGVGITPDVVVEDKLAALGQPNDKQLARGLDVALTRVASTQRTTASKR